MFNILKSDITNIGCETPHPVVGKHCCTLPSETDHGMHQLNPNASCISRMTRYFRKLTLPTYAHRSCRYFYPSRTQIVAAWKSTAATHRPFIVHPFSILALFWEMIMVITWSCQAFLRPYLFAFYGTERAQYESNIEATPTQVALITISAVCSLTLIINIGMNFVTGQYSRPGKSTVVIEFKKIAIRYLCTYFIFDFMDALPFASSVFGMNIAHRFWFFVHFLQFARVHTFYVYTRNVGHIGNIPNLVLDIFCFALFCFVVLHWLTCILCMLPMLNAQDGDDGFTKTTVHIYLKELKKITTHFFLGSCAFRNSEVAVMIATLILGWMFRTLCVAYLMIQVRLRDRCRRKYYTFVREMNQYMNMHNVSYNSNQRVNLFVKHKYHGKCYREEVLMQTFSEHLKNEVLLHASGHFICSLKLLRQLKRSIVGELITQLKPMFYAAGDVLYLSSDVCNTIYFISYGKIAAYTSQGVELMHFGDGHVIGVMGFYQRNYTWTAIAIDATEAFAWHRPDIEQMILRHTSVEELLHNLYTHRYKLIQSLVHERLMRRYTGPSAQIYMHLGEKKILEKRQLRRTTNPMDTVNKEGDSGCTTFNFPISHSSSDIPYTTNEGSSK